MAKSKDKVLGFLQKLGKSLMIPIAVLPAAALLLRFGDADLLNIPWIMKAGAAVFDNLPIIFALGIATGFAKENNGIAAISALIGYFVINGVALSFNKTINMGVFGGIIAGITAGLCYNKFKDIKLSNKLKLINGNRLIPLISLFVFIIIGIVLGFIWPPIQKGLDSFANFMAQTGPAGAFGFGFFNRLLIPFGLHHIVNTVFWQQLGSFTTEAGKVVMGDYNRFLAGDPTAGAYLTGFFPIMMFGLPAACLAMITTAKKEKKKVVAGMLISLAITSFLTGITEPIEFAFMFLSPMLYGVHSLLTGAALAITNAFGMRNGFAFSAGATDFFINWGKATKPLSILFVGLIFSVIYYFVFVFFIKKFDLKTPGREDDIEEDAPLNNLSLEEKALNILASIGGKENIDSLDACITRIRVTLKDTSKLDEIKLKKMGISGIMKIGTNNVQIVVGTMADPIVTRMKKL